LLTEKELAELREVWDSIPNIKCQGKCYDACTTLDFTSPIEKKAVRSYRMERRLPYFEFKVLSPPSPEIAKHRAEGHVPDDGCLNCPYLTAQKRCSVYSVRPILCRIYGVSELLRCPFGCEPERVLTVDESSLILRNLWGNARRFNAVDGERHYEEEYSTGTKGVGAAAEAEELMRRAVIFYCSTFEMCCPSNCRCGDCVTCGKT
jgi:Fe-S-cluster containining protein